MSYFSVTAMKYHCFFFVFINLSLSLFAQNMDTKNDDSIDLRGIVVEELTWSLSRRNYYIPIYVRCDDSSNVQLILATSWDLYCNYQYRYSVSEDKFRQILRKTTEQNDTLQGICIQDFEHLYDSNKGLFRGQVFVSKVNKYTCKYLNYDRVVLVDEFFDGRKCYKGDMKILPVIAYRLKEFGILLIYTDEGISYCDVSGKHHGLK